MEVGLLLLRFVTGLLLAGHGSQKLFGWFGGHGLRGTAGFVESLGWRPGRRFTALLGLAELASGVALALGLGVAGWLTGAAARHGRDHGSGGQVPSESGEPVGTGEAADAAEPLGAGAVAPPRPRHEVIVLLEIWTRPRRGRSATRGPSAPWP